MQNSIELRESARWSAAAVLGCVLTFTGCGEPAPTDSAPSSQGTAIPPFSSLFQEDRLVTLDEPDTALITALERIAVRQQDGAWAIPDRMESAVRIYDRRGRLKNELGRFGDGPGEYRHPMGVAFVEDGSLLVADAARPRITRYTPALTYDTTFFLPNAPLIFPILSLNGNMVIAEQGPPSVSDAPLWGVYNAQGRKTAGFHTLPDAIFSNPYWFSALGSEPNMHSAAVLGERFVVANALLYPLVAYDTVTWSATDTIRSPPHSWITIPRVEPGFFSPPKHVDDFNRWRRTYSTLAGVFSYHDTLLVVSHKSFPATEGEQRAEYYIDIYDAAFEKLATDVKLPGKLLGIGDGLLVQRSEPPDPWRVGVFVYNPERTLP